MRTNSLASWASFTLPPLFALAFACSAPPSGPDPEKALALHREQALGYYESGRLDQAEDQIMKALDISPKDDQLKLMLGWCRQRKGTREDLNVAERVFRDLAPRKDYRALLGLAECLERKGVLYTESADKIEKGELETQATDPKARATELRRDARKLWEESVVHYKAVMELRPDEIQGMSGLQRTYSWLDRPEDSVEWAEKLLQQAEAEVSFWQKQLERTDLRADEETHLRDRLGETREICLASRLSASALLVRLGRKTDALSHLDAVVLADPSLAAAYSRRGQVLAELGRYEEARANFDDFLRLSDLPYDNPDVQRVFKSRAECDKKLQELASPKQ